jgi:hypothetical protein
VSRRLKLRPAATARTAFATPSAAWARKSQFKR